MSNVPAFIQVHWEFGDYAESYRFAARQLVAALVSKPESLNDLSFPTLFLYRHAFELALKDASVWTEMTISQDTASTPSKSVEDVRDEIQGHNLRPLLDRLQHRFRLLHPHQGSLKPEGLQQEVGPAVAALDAMDVDGQRLRYPYLSRGRGRSWSRERQGASNEELLVVCGLVEVALNHLLEIMGAWFSVALDEAIEDAWIIEFWEAEKRARRLEAIHAPADGYALDDSGMTGDPDLVDDLKAELSADLLIDLPDE